jgi:hypothetical protein
MASLAVPFRRRVDRPTTASSFPDASRRRLVEAELLDHGQRQRPATALAFAPSRRVLPPTGVMARSLNASKKPNSSTLDTTLDRARVLAINPKIGASDREVLSELIAMVEGRRTPKSDADGGLDTEDLRKEIEEVRAENLLLVEHHRDLKVCAVLHALPTPAQPNAHPAPRRSASPRTNVSMP